MAERYACLVRIVSKHYISTQTANLICPPSLALIVVHVNRLRSLAIWHFPEDEPTPPTPNELLQDISTLSVTEWADSVGDGAAEVQSLGLIYHSAVALFCILSLQSIALVGETPVIEAQKAMHYDRLMEHLRAAALSPRLRTALFWPHVVAGVAAVRGSAGDRAFIGEQLLQQRKLLGQATPGIARDVLLRFWRSGGGSWDDCFDRPYCFSV